MKVNIEAQDPAFTSAGGTQAPGSLSALLRHPRNENKMRAAFPLVSAWLDALLKITAHCFGHTSDLLSGP